MSAPVDGLRRHRQDLFNHVMILQRSLIFRVHHGVENSIGHLPGMIRWRWTRTTEIPRTSIREAEMPDWLHRLYDWLAGTLPHWLAGTLLGVLGAIVVGLLGTGTVTPAQLQEAIARG